jgi:RNA polymerase sigma factor (sigma-70 family)
MFSFRDVNCLPLSVITLPPSLINKSFRIWCYYIVNKVKFEKIYKEFALPLTKFVMKRMGAPEAEVEEVVEETVVAAWRGWNTFEHKSTYFTWICRIALNKIADYYHDQVNKNSRIVVPLIDALTEPEGKSLSPEESLALKELRASVNECLDLMPPEKRRLLQFRYWYDLSYSEISKIMGISERAVEGQLYRARSEFAKVWSILSDSSPKNP